MDENLAVLLGLGLGGMGGYFGSKNRRESEAERLAMLLNAQKPDPNVESDAIKLFKLQEAERKRIGEENLLREQEAKADAEALDEEYFSLGDIFVDPFTKGIKKDSVGIPDFLQEGPLVDAASKLFGLAEEGLDNVTSGPLADKVRAGRDKFGEFIANNLVSGPAVDATSDQLRQFQENLTSGPAEEEELRKQQPTREKMNILNQIIGSEYTDSGLLDKAMGSGDFPIGTDFSRPNSDRTVTRPDMMFIYDRDGNIKPEFLTSFSEMYPEGNDPFANELEGFNFSPEVMELLGLNQGGRVGLANGGLGYSYKNNIFSADPSTGIPAIVDAGGDDGVADDTFIDLFPGLFPPVETPTENILDTPVMPMGGGGGDGFKFGDLDNYGINPMYGEGSGYDPDDPENSFLDKLGYGFYSNVMKPGAMLAKKLPTPMNIVSNLLGDQDFKLSDLFSNLNTGKGDPDPKPETKTPSVNSTVPTQRGGGSDGKGGFGGSSKKGDSKGFGNNRDFGGGPAKGTSRF